MIVVIMLTWDNDNDLRLLVVVVVVILSRVLTPLELREFGERRSASRSLISGRETVTNVSIVSSYLSPIKIIPTWQRMIGPNLKPVFEESVNRFVHEMTRNCEATNDYGTQNFRRSQNVFCQRRNRPKSP